MAGDAPVWYTWTATSSATTTNGSWGDNCFKLWITSDSTTSATVCYRDNVWTGWTTGTTTANSNITFRRQEPPAPSPEQVRKAQQATLKANLKKKRAERKARIKALDLLRLVLTLEEFQDYRRHGSVRVRTQRGWYEVGGRASGKLYRLNEQGVPTQKLCYSLHGSYCREDNVAAIVLALKLNEEQFLRETRDNQFEGREKERVALRRFFREAA